MITTKSSQITQDLDIRKPMARKGLAQVSISLTTLDQGRSRSLELRCPTPVRRVNTLKHIADAGIETGVMLAPFIPVLTEPEVEAILEVAASAGAVTAGYVLLRLPFEIKDLFRDWLEAHHPFRTKRIHSLIRATRRVSYISRNTEKE